MCVFNTHHLLIYRCYNKFVFVRIQNIYNVLQVLINVLYQKIPKIHKEIMKKFFHYDLEDNEMVCCGLFMLQGHLPNEYFSTLVNYSMFSFNIILFGICKDID